jgi:hypothetical protein
VLLKVLQKGWKQALLECNCSSAGFCNDEFVSV